MAKALLRNNQERRIEKNQIYYWTVSINKYQPLLEKKEYKNVVLDSLQYLTNKDKIDVFAFVILPDQIQLIWRINELNGKESPHGSFLKYTAHIFQRMLREKDMETLWTYKVDAGNKKYQFWQPDSVAIPLFTRKLARQKLTYIHNDPLAERWQLVKDPCEYWYSSARYYELNEKSFPFLKYLWKEI